VSDPLNPPPLTIPNAGLKTARVAVLMLDESGKVMSANQEAKALWQTGESELVGEFFPALFALDIVSEEPEMLEAQWDILLAAMLDKRAILSVQPKEGAPRAMAVRAEKAMGLPAKYIVVIETPLESGPVFPAPVDEQAAALQLFAEMGPATPTRSSPTPTRHGSGSCIRRTPRRRPTRPGASSRSGRGRSRLIFG